MNACPEPSSEAVASSDLPGPQFAPNAPNAPDPQGFAQWMAELDGMQALRARDPARALALALARRGRWVDLLPAQDALLNARCALQVAAAHLVLGDHTATRQASDALDALLLHRDLLTADAPLRQHALRCGIAGANVRATLAHGVGDFAGALRAYLGALDVARAIGDRRYEAHLLVNLANCFEECGLAAQSLEHSQLALGIAHVLGMDELVGDIHHNIGNALAALGDPEQGLASNHRALDGYAALGLAQKQSYALVAVAERLLELGRLDEAARALHERGARRLDYVNQQYEAYAAYLSGRIAVAQGDAAPARQAFERALGVAQGPLGDRVGQARSLVRLAQLDVDAGQLDTAWARASQALALLDGSQAQRDAMQTHQLLSAVAKARGDPAEALRHHEAFHAGYEQCFNEESARKARLLAVRHEVDLARAEALRERLENARLTEALAEIGARLRSSQASGPARMADIKDGAPPALPTCPQDLRGLGLTAREAEVLFWVTQGKTNIDVTLILDTSMSAVKKHLGRVYDKLGVDNRTAAADAVRRRRAN